ncbi:CHAT domain-containing protein [Prosthecobacter sp.]|uniref:CHAT domain-containing protein n=1 Tax=Prosthecobacter sp. TaxID=1965333 RepID=UPI003782F9A9
MSGSCRFFALLAAVLMAGTVGVLGQNAPSRYIVADPVADMVENGQVIGRLAMGQVVSIQALAENGAWGLVTVGGVSGWVSSKNLVPARPLSIAYFQGTNHFNLARQAAQQGGKEVARKEFGAAIPLLRNAVDLAQRENNGRYVASAATNLAISYDESQQYSKAEAPYLLTYRTHEAMMGAGQVQLGTDARNLAFFYQRWKHPKEALEWHGRALEVFENKFGPEHGETARERLEVGCLIHSELRQLGEAEAHLVQAHAVLLRTSGANDAYTLKAAQELAEVYSELGRAREAEALYRQVLAAREATVGPEDLSVAGTCQLLAGVCTTLGKDAEVESLLLRSLRIREIRLGAAHPHLIVSQRDLADLCSASGRFVEAEEYLGRAKFIAESIGKNSVELANVLEGFGNLRKQQGRYDQAEEMYQRSLAILEKGGKGESDIAHTLGGLSRLYLLTERYDAAAPVLQRRLRLLEAAHGKEALQLVDSIEDLATVQRIKGRLGEAEALEKRALEIVGRYPESKAYGAAAWNNLGAIYAVQKKFQEAGDAYRRSLELFQQTLGARNHRTAFVRINLALQEQRLGHAAEARRLAAEARGVLEQCPGDFDQARALALLIEADSGREEGHAYEALQAAQSLRRLMRERLNKMLLVRSESERLQFLQGPYAADLHRHLAWALEPQADQGVIHATAEWVLNAKNLANELQANLAKISRHAENERVQAMLAELETVRSLMAEMTWSDGPAAHVTAEMTRLAAEQDRLVREIRALGTPETVGGAWSELDMIRQALPARSCLIEMMKLRLSAGREIYVAWLIPPPRQGVTTVVNLGDAGKIEQAVAALHQEISEAPEHIVKEGEAAAEKRLQAAARGVAQLVLDPLLPALKEVERCYMAPDAALWLVPWASLPTAEGAYLVEKLEICQVASGRELTRPANAVSGTAPLIMADPDFDLSPRTAQKSLEALRGGQRGVKAPAAARSGMRGTLPALPKVERLPGTAAEAKAIAPALGAYAGAEAGLLTGDKALEDIFKTIQHPRVLMMSTHGFYFPASQTAQANVILDLGGPATATKGSGEADNPLLRCGLLLAGCNLRGKGAASSWSVLDDGVLSGLEILGVDLEGCELVVLSACETGLGKTEAGEGVAGLRQAFQLAGARGVMDTLWAIPDDETTQLMQQFFQGLARKLPPSAALREAQRQIIASRRQTAGAAHPFFWGAFGFTGR